MTFPPAPERIVHIQPSPWTEERVERLKQLTEQGLSASQIACELGAGISRNAVISKQHRIGVRSVRSRGSAPGSNNHPNNHAPARRYKRAPWAVPGLLANGKLLTDLPPLKVPGAVLKPLLALDDHQCRWPSPGDDFPMLFCGAPALKGYSYCHHHCRIAYSAPPPLTRGQAEQNYRKLRKNHKAAA